MQIHRGEKCIILVGNKSPAESMNVNSMNVKFTAAMVIVYCGYKYTLNFKGSRGHGRRRQFVCINHSPFFLYFLSTQIVE